MAGGAVIRTEELTVRYDALTAVDSLSMEVPEGSVYGFIGPNGAGKTSTIRVLMALLEAADGRAWVGGHDVDDEPEQVRSLIGYMPDFFGVYDHLFVWEYLELFGDLHGLPRAAARERAEYVLAVCDLQAKREAMVGGLSRGMKQRLCLARALLPDPPILILDEPASGVDPTGRYQIRQLIRRLGDEGKTIFVSSHILLELGEICDHVGIIEAGRLRASGPLEQFVGAGETGRLLRMRLLTSDADRAAEMVRGLDGVHDATGAGASLDVRIPDDDNAHAEVLARLSAAGFRIGHIAEERASLEEIYRRMTKGELA